MNRSAAMQHLMATDPALAGRVLLWESCGLLVRIALLRIALQTKATP